MSLLAAFLCLHACMERRPYSRWHNFLGFKKCFWPTSDNNWKLYETYRRAKVKEIGCWELLFIFLFLQKWKLLKSAQWWGRGKGTPRVGKAWLERNKIRHVNMQVNFWISHYSFYTTKKRTYKKKGQIFQCSWKLKSLGSNKKKETSLLEGTAWSKRKFW